MGYKITYDSSKQKIEKVNRGRLMLFTLLFFAMFLLFASHFAPEQLHALRMVLFGEANVAALLQEIQEGEGVMEAVAAFCQGILNGN